MITQNRRGFVVAAFLVAVAGVAGCVDERVVYRDRPLFEEPPAGAQGFLGYSDADGGMTVCGNCHIGKQKAWEQTAHAGAWHTLEASGSSRELCESCHSVSSRGNHVTETNVGWVATKDPRYQDVQCESCHGPGLNHVTNPDAPGNKPLAPLAVGTDLTLGCGQCHSGVHRPFVEDWQASAHGNLRPAQATNPACSECHEAKAVLEAWGVKATFMEQEDQSTLLPITCAVCHDPHDARNEGQLRFAMSEPVVERNLCMKCHHKRGEPDPTTFRGPHSPEGPLLLGTGGWWPPNFEYPQGSIVGTHGSEANPRLCATCHVNDYQYTDQETGAFVLRATGHSFEAIPCMDENGLPVPHATCDVSQRSFRACVGCHGSESAARSALIVARARIERLVQEIEPLIAQIPASEFNDQDNRYTTGEGARFNMELAQMTGSAVHNPFLVEALLIASIRQIELDYGITGPPAAVLEPRLTAPPGIAHIPPGAAHVRSATSGP